MITTLDSGPDFLDASRKFMTERDSDSVVGKGMWAGGTKGRPAEILVEVSCTDTDKSRGNPTAIAVSLAL